MDLERRIKNASKTYSEDVIRANVEKIKKSVKRQLDEYPFTLSKEEYNKKLENRIESSLEKFFKELKKGNASSYLEI